MKLWGQGIECVSWGGRQYAPGPDGAFDVPAGAVEDLLSHGLTRTPPDAPLRLLQFPAAAPPPPAAAAPAPTAEQPRGPRRGRR